MVYTKFIVISLQLITTPSTYSPSMASATAISHKRLGEFLNQQQPPFILEDYLLERGYSKKRRSMQRSSSSCLNKNAKSLLPSSKVLTALYKKLAFHSQTNITRESNVKKENFSVPETDTKRIDHIVEETDRFASASNSTLFNEEDETSISPHKDHPSFSSHTCQASEVCYIGVQSQQATNNGKQRRRCIEDSPVSPGRIPSPRVPVSQNDGTLNQDVRKIEKRLHTGSVLLPKNNTDHSLLSASLWGLLIQSAKKENFTSELQEHLGPNVSQILKYKKVLQKTKQFLFYCVREITITLPRKNNGEQDYKQVLGPEQLGKLICKGKKEWGQRARYDRNLTYLFTLDYLNSIYEWSDFEPHVKDISVEIADAILECINNEIVSEITENLPII